MRNGHTHLLIPNLANSAGSNSAVGKYTQPMITPNQFTWSRVNPNSVTTDHEDVIAIKNAVYRTTYCHMRWARTKDHL
jgi:hypothetical protein